MPKNALICATEYGAVSRAVNVEGPKMVIAGVDP
jgi:hypothetical protein